MRISILPLKSVEIEKLDKAFKAAGFSTILEPSSASLSNEEKKIFAKLLGISSGTNTTLSARLGIYADENGIVKVVDIRRNYVKDPVIVVYDRDDQKRTTSGRVKKVLVNVLSFEIMSCLLRKEAKQILADSRFALVIGDLARIQRKRDSKKMATEILEKAFAAVNSAITSYTIDSSIKIQEPVVATVK